MSIIAEVLLDRAERDHKYWSDHSGDTGVLERQVGKDVSVFKPGKVESWLCHSWSRPVPPAPGVSSLIKACPSPAGRVCCSLCHSKQVVSDPCLCLVYSSERGYGSVDSKC